MKYERISSNEPNSLEIKIRLLTDLQKDLFKKEEKVENGYRIIIYKSSFLSKMNKDLTMMLDMTNKLKLSEKDRKEKYKLDERLDFKGMSRKQI